MHIAHEPCSSSFLNINMKKDSLLTRKTTVRTLQKVFSQPRLHLKTLVLSHRQYHLRCFHSYSMTFQSNFLSKKGKVIKK